MRRNSRRGLMGESELVLCMLGRMWRRTRNQCGDHPGHGIGGCVGNAMVSGSQHKGRMMEQDVLVQAKEENGKVKAEFDEAHLL